MGLFKHIFLVNFLTKMKLTFEKLNDHPLLLSGYNLKYPTAELFQILVSVCSHYIKSIIEILFFPQFSNDEGNTIPKRNTIKHKVSEYLIIWITCKIYLCIQWIGQSFFCISVRSTRSQTLLRTYISISSTDVPVKT